MEKGQRRKRGVAKEKPGKPPPRGAREEPGKMALHSPDPKFIPGDSEQGRVPSDNGINLWVFPSLFGIKYQSYSLPIKGSVKSAIANIRALLR